MAIRGDKHTYTICSPIVLFCQKLSLAIWRTRESLSVPTSQNVFCVCPPEKCIWCLLYWETNLPGL